MDCKQHPDYKTEKVRLEETMTYLENVIHAIEESRSTYKEDIKEAYKSLDPSDSSLSYVSIMLNTKLLDQLEKNYRSYMNVRRKPYFARIDIKQEGEKDTEKLYIGKASLFKKDMEPVIIDWRSPIASVYYDGRLGEVAYKTTGGMINAQLYLKRQYTINNGRLENFMDIDITANDAFLQASLSGYADDRLKDIASTIQAEQNAIIRADLDRPLIVQGVAGSGKTTIALHRIAYLIYTYEDRFDPDQFMIIAPNTLFLNYIADVLPELGVEQVHQTTFIDFAFEFIGHKFQLTNSDEKILAMIKTNPTPEEKMQQEIIKNVAGFKGSLVLRDLIDRYVNMIEQDFVPDTDFYVDDLLILRAREINQIFLNECHYSAFYKRLPKIKKYLNSCMKGKVHTVVTSIENEYKQKVHIIKSLEITEEEKRQQIISLLDERDNKVKRLKNSAKTSITKYMAKFPKKKLIDYYITIITNPSLMRSFSRGLIDDILLKQVAETSEKILYNKKIEVEDLTPLMYLQYKIFGIDEKIDVKYVVIDEAQDLSLFQFYTLKTILDTERFTILGDLAQGIHDYKSISNWDSVLESIFTQYKSNYLTLEQSYRTTIEIMEFANKVIKLCPLVGTVLAKPVMRHGESPEIITLSNKEDFPGTITKKIIQYKQEGYHSIAIIGKTHDECVLISKMLNGIKMKGKHNKSTEAPSHKKTDNDNKVEVVLLDSKEKNYNNNVVIVPSYLAKGLEFDAVILANYNEYYTSDPLDLKLLYVAITRALHKVSIISYQSINSLEAIPAYFTDTIPIM